MTNIKKLILLGAPGAGKGTFAGQVKELLPNIVHISTGDIFRENLKNKTDLGLKVQSYLDKGKLVPDKLVNDLMEDTINKKDIKKNGFILDGYPRTLNQAEALNKMINIDSVILLEVTDDIIIRRILGRYSCPKCGALYNMFFTKPKKEGICDKCGAKMEFVQRADDNEQTIKQRLEVYKENAKPIIDYYKKQKKIIKVDYPNQLPLEDIKKIIGL